MVSCQCTNPPGGIGRCESDQIAVCQVIDGECNVTCVDRRTYVNNINLDSAIYNQDINAIITWFTIIAEDLNLDINIDYDNYSLFVDAIREHRFLNRNGEIVTFRMPSDLEDELDSFLN